MKNTIRLANIKDIVELARQIKDNWALCQLFEGERRAFEAEYLVAETVHACKFNHATHGEAFSWLGENAQSRQGGGLMDNSTAYDMLLREKYLVEEIRDGKPILFMTQKLIDLLKEYLRKP